MRKLSIGVVLFLSSAVLLAQTKNTPEEFSPARLGNVLSCLQAKLSAYGDAPPRFDARSFRVRYLYGKESAGDEDDELHIVVYGPREDSAILFEVYLNAVDDNKRGMIIGLPATLKREHGRLVVDELPGGQATLRRIDKLLGVISHRPLITIMNNQVRPGSLPCVAGP